MRAGCARAGYGWGVAVERDIRNVALIGFMGSGKSAVGKLVAAELGFDFLDTDEKIEQAAGMSIPEIFRSLGEAGFREWERRIVRSLAGLRNTVIATGGGLPTYDDHLERLKEHSLVVCLWASPEVLFERVRHHTHRPLLQTEDPLQRIRELLARREPWYRRADVMIGTEQRSIREVAAQVIHAFRLHTRARA
ncbi:shikimate kinase [Limisphaera ngatamarikiensis]|uniref:shikimate kinase n=1 Tax=Limisphaera ngatamarikiensis TaxID=1324935 RepID=UPI0019818180|nr:shikimate kinase [Limisphaera ngatamarikiensis]